MNKDIQKAYNKAAKTYQTAGVIYREIGERLLSRLDYIHIKPKVILDIGCGRGDFSRDLSLRYPEASVISLDFSEKMLELKWNPSPWGEGARRAGEGRTQAYILGNMEKLPFQTTSVDMIWANQSIQDIENTAALFQEFHRVLKPGGVLFFSSLGPDSLKELKKAWSIVDTYGHVNALKDLHHLGDELLSNQFLQPVVDAEYITLHYQRPESLLKDLKEQGSYNIHPLRRRGLMGQDALAYLHRGLEEERNTSGKIPLTYEVIYGHAWRGENKPVHNKETGETFISLDQIRVKRTL